MTNKSSMDARRRRVFLKKMCENTLYKSITENQTLPFNYRQFYHMKYNGKKYSSTRIRNRCILTGRSRGVYKFCKLSRIKLREYASAGVLMGISKYSW